MVKNKYIKYLISVFVFLLFLISYNNYVTYKRFNPKKLISKPIILNKYNNQSLTFDSDYIYEFATKEVTDRNAMDIYYKNLELVLPTDKNNTISSISIETPDIPEEINLVVEAYSGDIVNTYSYNNLLIKKDNSNIIVINKKGIDKIVIKCTRELFGNYNESGDINLEKISINDKNDYKLVKKKLICYNVYLLIAILISILVVKFLKYMKIYDKLPDEKLPKKFFIISIIFGIVFSILIPLYQIPDELTHINMILNDLNMKIDFNSESNGYGDTLRIMHKYDEKVNLDSYIDLDKKINIDEKIKPSSINLIKHFPQFIGIILGKILHLPIIICITLCEFLAVLFYSFIGYKTIKYMPFKKELMMLLMLLPICIQQMGSFSYDVMLLSMCYLFIGYLLYLKYAKEHITLVNILSLFLILIIITIVKLPYVLLGFLIVTLPLDKLNIKIGNILINKENIYKNKKIILIISIIVVILMIISGIFILNKMYFGRLLLAALSYPKKSIPLILKTLWSGKFYYIRGLTSEFGWLDTHSSILFTIFVIVSLLITCFINFKRKNKNIVIIEQPFKKWEIIYIYIIAITLIFIITLSMVDWTAVIMGFTDLDKLNISGLGDVIGRLPFIGGLQSRYYVPVLPLIFIPIFNKKISNKLSLVNLSMAMYLYYIGLFAYMFILLLNRYWI